MSRRRGIRRGGPEVALDDGSSHLAPKPPTLPSSSASAKNPSPTMAASSSSTTLAATSSTPYGKAR